VIVLTSQAHNSSQRRHYLGRTQPTVQRMDILCGEVWSLRIKKGAHIAITNVDGGSGAILTALSDRNPAFSPAPLGLSTDQALKLNSLSFDTRKMEQLATNRDTSLADGTDFSIFDDASEPGDLYVATAIDDCTLFVISPVSVALIASGGGGTLQVSVKPPTGQNEPILPPPLGKVIDEFTVSRATAQSYELKKGQFVQVIDVEGQQCSDFMAMRSSALDAGLERFIDSTVSRTMTRSAYPVPGLHDKSFDQDMRPLLAVRQDTVGRHDTFALACTARGYEERGFPGHINCSDNISEAFAPYGIQSRRAWPAINFFFNSWIDWADHHISSDEAWSRAGDYVAMEALTDLVCVSTACPDDVDPINGWNPTDVHVRIYDKSSAIPHAVSWRANPEDAGKMTQHSAFHPRTSKLTTSFNAARDLWMPNTFDATGAVEEYWACKTAATLQDMSGLRKYDIVGTDALALLQHCLTRDVAKLSVHRGFYALICDARGSVLDDGTLFRLEDTAFRWCCGSENSALHLREQALELRLNARVMALGDRVPNLALQGPKSRDILRRITFTQPTRPALDNLKWFGFTIARLHDRDGPMFMLCRTGFTGELGYEIFCDKNDAVEIWDALIEAGTPHGLKPMGGDALDMLRIEADLMTAGAEFGPESDALESGLGFAVDFKKPEFIGKAALERNATAVRRKLVGLHFNSDEAPHPGAGIFAGREQVGVITSACTSPALGHAIAMARVAVENADMGTPLEVGSLDGHMKRLPATVVTLPFIDPKREKARA